MKKIVLGLLFIFFNFNIPLNTSVINLIPSFIGYYFIIKACVRLADETSNPRYLETKKIASLLFVASLFIFVFDLLGLGAVNPVFSLIIGLLNVVLFIIFLHHLTQSISQTTQFNLSDSWIKQFKSFYTWIAILSIIGFILLIAPTFAVFVVLVVYVFNVRYLLMLISLKKGLDSQFL